MKPISQPISRSRCIALIALAAVGGVGAWVERAGGGSGPRARWIIILVAAAIGLLPPVARGIAAVQRATRQPTPATRNVLAICIAIASAGYFIATAANQSRDLFAKTNDDCSYLIGMRMLAHGRLWMPAPPTPDFYDSFYILVKPVYCSIYFPGTALLYVPTIWLHLPTWVMPVRGRDGGRVCLCDCRGNRGWILRDPVGGDDRVAELVSRCIPSCS